MQLRPLGPYMNRCLINAVVNNWVPMLPTSDYFQPFPYPVGASCGDNLILHEVQINKVWQVPFPKMAGQGVFGDFLCFLQPFAFGENRISPSLGFMTASIYSCIRKTTSLPNLV